MAVMDGCEGATKTPVLEERTCPKCGEIVEVFTVRGRVREDTPCENCDYIFKAEEQYDPALMETKKKKEA